jgi:hypothetical protein
MNAIHGKVIVVLHLGPEPMVIGFFDQTKIFTSTTSREEGFCLTVQRTWALTLLMLSI